jgi:hypothetical protein
MMDYGLHGYFLRDGPLAINLFPINYVRSHLEDIVEDMRIPEGDKSKTPRCACFFVTHNDRVLNVTEVDKILSERIFSGDSGNASNEHFPLIQNRRVLTAAASTHHLRWGLPLNRLAGG